MYGINEKKNCVKWTLALHEASVMTILLERVHFNIETEIIVHTSISVINHFGGNWNNEWVINIHIVVISRGQ